jgi:hypothetical protein
MAKKVPKNYKPWLFRGEPFVSGMETDLVGFVYVIRDTKNNRAYLGKKSFFLKKTKVVKGMKKRQKVSSNWPEYFGSNDELVAQLELHGEEFFEREILHLCPSLGTLSYLEAREQFERRVLEDDYWYNSWIMIRTRRSHIGKLEGVQSGCTSTVGAHQ